MRAATSAPRPAQSKDLGSHSIGRERRNGKGAEIAQRDRRGHPQRAAAERLRDERRRDAGERAIEVEFRGQRRSVTVITQHGAQEPRSSRGIRGWLTDWLSRYMSEPVSHYDLRGRNDLDQLKSTIRKGDVLLIDGDQRVSSVIKYLTRSSWSHAVLYIGDELLRRDAELERRTRETFGDAAEHLFVEALFDGVVASPLEKYIDYNVRLCRPHRLRSDHLKVVLDDAVAAIGWRYDLRNILDLAVHLIFVSLLPGRHREEVLRFGSGASSQVICTSLLGQLFHKVGFPVLPSVTYPDLSPRDSWAAASRSACRCPCTSSF